MLDSKLSFEVIAEIARHLSPEDVAAMAASCATARSAVLSAGGDVHPAATCRALAAVSGLGRRTCEACDPADAYATAAEYMDRRARGALHHLSTVTLPAVAAERRGRVKWSLRQSSASAASTLWRFPTAAEAAEWTPSSSPKPPPERTEPVCTCSVALQVHTRVLDRAMQVFGAMGLTPDTPLSYLWTWGRAMRYFDGPDEVHLRVLARNELAKARANRGSTAPYYTLN